jgi:serine/threonine protein kinase
MPGDNWVGEIVGSGKYKLLTRLGSGCFGTVYRAEEYLDHQVVREVALKIYSPEATKLGNIEGMFRDCALPARIMASDAPLEQKRHFVAIHDFGRMETPYGTCSYVSMELVRRADTLEDLMACFTRSGYYPSEENVVGYMKQFFEALALAHKAGVLHRDIKGANVMITDGVLKIVDFGMGAYLDDPHTPLKTTLSIYAPENFEGKYTVASDIYQAGLMFYQYFVGYAPFDKQPYYTESQTAFAQQLRPTFRYIPSDQFPNAHTSALLDSILSKCLRYAQDTRFQSAQEVLDALDRQAPERLVQEALDMGNYDYAVQLAKRSLLKTGIQPDEKVAMLWALGSAHLQKGSPDTALDFLKNAYDEAEKYFVFFHLPTRRNQLISEIAKLYEQKEQAGMARLWNKKLK